jgi:hypothetical protein
MLLLLGLLSAPAHAQQGPQLHMWGVGPAVGTVLFPARYPSKLPSALPNSFDYPFNRFNGSVGAKGVVYVNDIARVGLHGDVGGSNGWMNLQAGVRYDHMVFAQRTLHGFVGLGLGLGRDTYRSENIADGSGDGWEAGEDGGDAVAYSVLEVPYVLVRVQGGAILRNKTQAYELSLYGAYHVPREHVLDPGEDTEATIAGRGSRYAQLGLELAVYLGDFTPPKKKRNRGPKKKK